eukprot:scaffold94836_cov23-Prasinocladus_malaysianus.AAC.1
MSTMPTIELQQQMFLPCSLQQLPCICSIPPKLSNKFERPIDSGNLPTVGTTGYLDCQPIYCTELRWIKRVEFLPVAFGK